MDLKNENEKNNEWFNQLKQFKHKIMSMRFDMKTYRSKIRYRINHQQKKLNTDTICLFKS